MNERQTQTTTIPTWANCAAKHARGEKLTALEYFIHENEPRGFAGDYWRRDLADAIKEATNNAAA